MLNPSAITRLALSRRAIASIGVIILGVLFHFGITQPGALGRAEAPKGMQRLRQAFCRSSSEAALLFFGKPSTSLFGDAFHGVQSSTTGLFGKSTTAQNAPQDGVSSGPENIADPALLKTLQVALREKRDAEYIRRLRVFHRKPAAIFCPPLPSYSLKGLTSLSDSERYIASCHERKQLQARCVIPVSIFEPMRCPESYPWDISEQWQEEERKWLAERTSRH